MALNTDAFTATVLVAVIFAAAARTIIPFLAKRQADATAGLEPRPFSLTYLFTAVIGSVPIMVGAVLLLPTILPQIPNTGTQLMVFVSAFGLAYATTDLVNRNVSVLSISVPMSQVNQKTAAKLEAMFNARTDAIAKAVADQQFHHPSSEEPQSTTEDKNK